MKSILVVTGTRAEYGLLKPVLRAIRKNYRLELRLCVTGMHTMKKFGRTVDGIRTEQKVDCIVPVRESSMLDMLAQEIRGIAAYCEKNRPDCILVLGDRDEPLAAALVATHLNIPLAHIHGGDTTGPGVDEKNRAVITKCADAHFPATKKSADRIKRMGVDPRAIVIAGTPGLDGLTQVRHSRASVARTLGLDPKKQWLAFVQHPTAFDTAPLPRQIDASLAALSAFPDFEKIIIYPNSDTGSDIFISRIKKTKGADYHTFQSIPRDVYIALIRESEALIGNSSSGIIEANFLGTPAVDIGNRQRGRERGRGVIHVAYETPAIARGIRAALRMKKKFNGRTIPSPYGAGEAGSIIARTLASRI